MVTTTKGVWIEIPTSSYTALCKSCHSHEGSVDWNSPLLLIAGEIMTVTPTKGVWIEIQLNTAYTTIWHRRVTPTKGVWIEIQHLHILQQVLMCHSHEGSVDWNFYINI